MARLEAVEILDALPELLNRRLVGRGDRFLLRLARRVGFGPGFSALYGAGDQGTRRVVSASSWQLRLVARELVVDEKIAAEFLALRQPRCIDASSAQLPALAAALDILGTKYGLVLAVPSDAGTRALFVGSSRRVTRAEMITLQSAAALVLRQAAAQRREQNLQSECDALRERGVLGRLLAHLPTGVILVSPKGDIRILNKAASRLLSLGEGTPSSLLELEKACDLGLSLLVDEAAEVGGDILGREIVWGENPVRHLRADVGRVGDDNGDSAGMVLVLRDVTNRKRLELEQAEFVGTVSHELKTPLTSMRTCLELILNEEVGAVSEEQSHFLEMSQRNIDRLARLIEQLLDVARQESGNLALNRAEQGMIELLLPHLEGFRRTAHRDGKQLSWDLSPSARGFVDADRFTEVMENLVSNALKFSDTRGHVQVELREDQPCPDAHTREIARRLGRELRGFELTVRDDGQGMDAEASGHAFERFYQEGDPLADRPTGTGLGLAITRSLVSAHEGIISLESRKGEGTTVKVWIPQTPADGALCGAMADLAAQLAGVQRQLRTGHVVSLQLDGRSEEQVQAVEEACLSRGIGRGQLAWPAPGVVCLVLPRDAWKSPLRRSLRSMGVEWGAAAFPRQGTQLGTLLALSLGEGESVAVGAGPIAT